MTVLLKNNKTTLKTANENWTQGLKIRDLCKKAGSLGCYNCVEHI